MEKDKIKGHGGIILYAKKDGLIHSMQLAPYRFTPEALIERLKAWQTFLEKHKDKEISYEVVG